MDNRLLEPLHLVLILALQFVLAVVTENLHSLVFRVFLGS